MKTNLLIIATVLFSLFSCSSGNKNNTDPVSISGSPEKDHVEVLYFHGKQRCITCNAIENLTREVLNENFADELADGSLEFRVIDISEPQNEAIADKYEVTWASLFLNKWKDAEETTENMTDFGFSYAKSSPDVFKEGIKENVANLLK